MVTNLALQKKGKNRAAVQNFPPNPKKNNHFYIIDKSHTYLTQTYPNLIYFTCTNTWGPPPHRHFDAAEAPWVDSTLKVGSVGFAVRCSTVGIEEIKEISILVGTDVPLTFWKMLGVFDYS